MQAEFGCPPPQWLAHEFGTTLEVFVATIFDGPAVLPQEPDGPWGGISGWVSHLEGKCTKANNC